MCFVAATRNSIKMVLLSGAEFTAKHGNVFYKWINESRTHKDFTYKVGLNVDAIPFNPVGGCSAGGLHFTNIHWLSYYYLYIRDLNIGKIFLAKISIPDDSQVFVDGDNDRHIKADKIIIETFDYKLDEQEAMIVGRQSMRLVLQYAKEQPTHEMCMAAVRQNPFALQDVHENLQTSEMCSIAVAGNTDMLQFVKDSLRTPELCAAAARQRVLEGGDGGYFRNGLRTI